MFRPTSEDWPEREKKIYFVGCLLHARLGFYKVQIREKRRREKEEEKQATMQANIRMFLNGRLK
jgi:hypothetical protein